MKPNVLVIGSGGENKYDYLNWLVKLGARVILFEPEDYRAESKETSKWTTHFVPFDSIESVIDKAKKVASQFPVYAVDTISELAMEHAAAVRHELALPGLTPDLVRVGRDKAVMAEFMQKHGIRTAPFIIFDEGDGLKEIQERMKAHGDVPWILKPDCLAANIGVRRMKSSDEFIEAFNDAQKDIENHRYRSYIYYKVDRWIVSRFVEGCEMETEVCVRNGEVIFSAYLFKTISVERERGIEENRYITPVPWLTSKKLVDMDEQIQRIGEAVYDEVMRPCGKKTLVLHPEFRIDDEGHAYTLEFAFRNGGGLNPYRIEETTGVNPYYLSAAATLDMDIDIPCQEVKRASGYQMLFSDRRGRFEGVKGIKDLSGVEVKPEVSSGYMVGVPHAEPLVSIIASAPTPEDVDRLLNEAVRDAKVIVDGQDVDIPLSKYAD